MNKYLDEFIMTEFLKREEQQVRTAFYEMFHADVFTLANFAPEDFICKWYTDGRHDYYWCGKAFASIHLDLAIQK